MCRVLQVSRTGFHNWERRAPSDRALTDAWLTAKIKQIHEQSRGVYGAPRIHAELRMEHDVRVGHKRVARLMKAYLGRQAPQALENDDPGSQGSRPPPTGLSAGRRNRRMVAERIGSRTRRFVDWIQRRIEAPAPFAGGRDGYFWVMWRIDDVANLGRSAIHGRGRVGDRRPRSGSRRRL